MNSKPAIATSDIVAESRRRYSYGDTSQPIAVVILQRKAFEAGVNFALREMEALGAKPVKARFI